MTVASIEIIQYSFVDIVDGLDGNPPEIEAGLPLYIILGVGIFCKFLLWIFCRWANNFINSDILEALAEDHFNDVISNGAAIATVAVAFNVNNMWWIGECV